MEEFKKRKTPRWQKVDYNCIGVYFLTICTQDRRCILSRVVGTGVPDCPQIELTKYGKIADKYIRHLNEFYDNISIVDYVIMPNHIHMLLWVKTMNEGESGQSGTPVPTVLRGDDTESGQSRMPVPTNVVRSNNTCSKFVSTFKRFCNKEYGENIWQVRFNDHIIRNREDYEKHMKYIYKNPVCWYYDELYSEK